MNNETDASLVKTAINLAHSLGLQLLQKALKARRYWLDLGITAEIWRKVIF
ncbi:MAG: hypothetical protein PHO08_13955 [Methylococcales bacterium]|nr:hypothetical protein [Methylococcales bacterium]